MKIIESLFLTGIIFLINGVLVFNYFRIKNWLFNRVLADFYLPTGRRFIFNKKEFFLIFLLILSIFLPTIHLPFPLTIIFLVSFNGFLFYKRLSFFKKIPITPKAFLLLIIFLLINFFIIFLSPNLTTFLFLSLFISQLFLFALVILIFEIIVRPYLIFLRNLLKNKIKKTNIKKIVIVGSYGKSTTKEFLVQLLKRKFRVLSLPPRINHEYAILKFLLKQDLENFDFLVVELGSYFLGNIKWTTKAIVPDYLFITGISKQHYFLFGEKIENVIKAEGTEALTYMEKGVIFLNSSHEYFNKLFETIKKTKREIKIVTYGKGGDYNYQILTSDISKASVELITKDKKIEFQTKIIFPQQIENLVGVLAFLLEENLFDPKELKNFVSEIELPDGFLKLKVKNNLYIFDDSYNANPKGVIEGMNFFETLNFDFKIVIFNGLLELGKETKKIYSEIAKKMEVFDIIIFTSDNYYEFFKEKLKEKAILVKKDEELKKYLEGLKYKKIGIWIFNRFPETIKDFLKTYD